MKRILAIAITMALIMPISMLLTVNTVPIVLAEETRDSNRYIFVEDFTTTWCSHCPYVVEALNNTYNSGDYNFYFVSMICDMVEKADERGGDYTIPGYPTVIFDGGYEDQVGSENDNTEETEEEIKRLIESCEGRTNYIPLTMEVEFFSAGKGLLEIYVNMKNEDTNDYTGRLRTHITEIVSRYIDDLGDRYPFGFLDFAFDEDVSIPAGQWLNKSIVWNGSEHQDTNGDDFGDIVPENIMIISVLFNSDATTEFYEDYFNQPYIAYYVDQATGATVSQGSYGVELSSSLLNKNANPSETITYSINVKNTGKKTDTISLSVDNVPSGWSAKIENQDTYSVNLNAGETKTVNLQITPPSDAIADTIANIDIIGTSQGDNAMTSKITTSTTVNTIYDVEITCTQNQKNGDPSSTISYNIDVKNKGNAPDTINLDSGTGNWQTTFSKISVDLDANSKETITANVKIPESANANSYEQRTITATSGGDNSKQHSITIKTTVNAVRGVDITTSTTDKSILSGGSTKYTLSVKNTGNVQDSFSLSTDNVPSGWSADFDISSLNLNAYETKDVILTVNAPSSANEGDVAIIITNVVSTNDNNIKDTISLTITVASPTYDLGLTCSQTEKTATTGDTITYLLTLTNNGNIDDTFDLSLGGENSAWGSLDFTSVSLGAGESKDITLTINVPSNANYGDKVEITVKAVSRGDNSVSKEILTITTITKLPDFTVEEIMILGSLIENSALTIIATIKNSGEKADNLNIAFYVDNDLKDINTMHINANSQLQTTFNWNAVAGEHTIKISPNYDNAITESDATNNEMTKTINILSEDEINAKPPTIIKVEYSPLKPKVNEEITFIAEITDDDLEVVKFSMCSPSGVCSFPANMTLIDGKYTIKITPIEVGETKFTITARDLNGNKADKEIKIDIISAEITFSSSEPKVNEDLIITAPIVKTNEISKVICKYSYDNGETWEEVDMSYENGEYTAIITPTETGVMKVKIDVKDKSGKVWTYAEKSVNVVKQDEVAKSFIPGFGLVVLLVGIIWIATIFRRRKL